ncbi:enoyl-ACP reductase FabV [Photobacterium lucens]|uniref:enoyl-ACP reductase FabV n=1 Tax=Photobacterium lucens TaxID=2562949 RepID=UPI00136A17EA|nr:enoyl-ACP reductase FabV [Photobacterium lucens]MBP2698741.1 trans-2-enoyl-CoA reductase family protein [Vibrio parahaemolyticus]MZG57657.1 trans-2-enoyl-CoA reductase family protein [Photobacterium lucens]MZG79935.1 trans-2-enoyl-CoA reductase family protein [Photobacterium lucens]
MVIKPEIQGVVARTAHPYGCQQAVQAQIAFVESAAPITQGPKRVLILGASSGFGLASRIALTFGGAQAATLGVSFERGPSVKGVGTAGWYNNIYFKQAAEQQGYIAKNIVGDAFSPQIRQQVAQMIRDEFDGQVDLVIYSLATGVRPNPENGDMWRSCLKTVGENVSGFSVDLEKDSLVPAELTAANEDEILATTKVMGGEDWQEWIDFLLAEGLLATGAKTLAYSYIGPESTYPIYHHGTLGIAKQHLHHTATVLNQQLSQCVEGQANVVVCKALVTKASVFIPTFSPYILCLFKVMKQLGLHEECIEQMQRLFADKVYAEHDEQSSLTDENGLIRMDDWELKPEVQQQVDGLMAQMNVDNFKQVGDYAGYKSAFLALNGFGFSTVDYTQSVDLDALSCLTP